MNFAPGYRRTASGVRNPRQRTGHFLSSQNYHTDSIPSRADFKEAVSRRGSGRIEAGKMVTRRFPLDKLDEALNLAGDYRDGVVKAMVEL